MKSCVIFAGGEPVTSQCVDFERIKDSFVVCADRGYDLAKSLGVRTDMVIGDFDSTGFDIGQIAENVQTKRFPSEKDDTDLMLAVKEGLKKGCGYFVVYGALGGRFDQTFASVQTLAFIVENGGRGEIVSDTERLMLFSKGSYDIDKIDGRYISLFAYSKTVEGLSIKGAKYSLENGILLNSLPLGVSNEFDGDTVEISFNKGMLLVVLSQKNQH